MTSRQFLWGLSSGITVFALSGTFWFGLGVTAASAQAGWVAGTLAAVIHFAVGGSIFWAGLRLRRRSGFQRSELRQGDERARAETRRIVVVFLWTNIAQSVVISIAAWWCVQTQRVEMIWPSIGLVLGLHLIPLARTFHLRAYYVTALVASLVSLVGFTPLVGDFRRVFVGGAMACVMWVTAVYVLRNADRIAAQAVSEPWAV